MKFNRNVKEIGYKDKVILANCLNGYWIRLTKEIYYYFLEAVEKDIEPNMFFNMFEDQEDREYNGLYSFSRQIHLRQPTNITNEIVTAAFQLFKDNYKWEHPIRSLGIRAADLVLDDIPVQLDLFGNQEKKEKLEKLDRTVDEIRRRFGYFSIQRAAMYQDKVLSHLDAGTHTIHPHSYFHG